MVRLPNPQRVDQWRSRFRRFEIADTTVAQFCRQEHCSVVSFYQWRRKLETDRHEAAGGTIVAVELKPTQATEPSHAMIQIELPGGAIVRLDADSKQHVLQNSILAIVQATTVGRAS